MKQFEFEIEEKIVDFQDLVQWLNKMLTEVCEGKINVTQNCLTELNHMNLKEKVLLLLIGQADGP